MGSEYGVAAGKAVSAAQFDLSAYDTPYYKPGEYKMRTELYELHAHSGDF